MRDAHIPLDFEKYRIVITIARYGYADKFISWYFKMIKN